MNYSCHKLDIRCIDAQLHRTISLHYKYILAMHCMKVSKTNNLYIMCVTLSNI
jgi:hypothetical protein